jgi:hypothetical protein
MSKDTLISDIIGEHGEQPDDYRPISPKAEMTPAELIALQNRTHGRFLFEPHLLPGYVTTQYTNYDYPDTNKKKFKIYGAKEAHPGAAKVLPMQKLIVKVIA